MHASILSMSTKSDKNELLNKSKHFCMLPWVHMHILPSSAVTPCCVWPYREPLGNLKDNSLKEIWNNDQYKDLRLKMLKDEYIPQCSQCYERQDSGGHALRTTSNQEWGRLFNDVVPDSEVDGELKKFKMALFDIRFSNICNFKCRGCSPELSSAWLSDHEKLFNYKSQKDKLISIMPNEAGWNELVGFLPGVERAYFAGGEPLIMDEHYLILEELIKLEKFSVPLSYNSNMSNLKFRDKMVMEYWKKFKVVHVGISIDDFAERGEYFRHGMKWQKVVENIKTVQAECPHVVFSINCTVSLFNAYYLPELHAEALRLGIIKLGDFFSNLLVDPHEYRVQNLPLEFKEKVAKKIKDYIQHIQSKYWLTNPHGVKKLKNAFDSVIHFMNSGEGSAADYKKFLSNTKKLDEIRNEDFKMTYPELAFLEEYAQKKVENSGQ